MAKSSKKKSKEVIIIPTSNAKASGGNEKVVVANLPGQKKKKSKSARSRGNASKMQEFIEAVMYPDLIGPIRVPISGCSDKTVLAMDRSKFVITGNGTNTVQGVACASTVGGTNAFVSFTATSETTGFTTTLQNAGNLFPPVSSWSDARLVGTSIIGYYTGTALNAVGEVLLCSLPDNQTGFLNLGSGVNYQSLYYLQDSIHMPIAQTLGEPVRVSGYHQSPLSWSFIAVGGFIEDINLPLLVTSGLGVGTTFVVEVCRTWEVRSSLTSNGVPYAVSGESRVADDNAFSNAMDYIGHLPSAVSEAVPNILSGVANSVIDSIPMLARGTSQVLLQHVTNRMFGNLRNPSNNMITYR